MTRVTIIRGRGIDPAVHKICGCLAQNGYSVRLLVWDRQQNVNKKNSYGYPVDTFNLRAPYDKLSAVMYFPFWWIFIFFYLLKNRSDVIHACDFDTLIPAILVKVLRQTGLCYTIFDFYADNIPTRFPSVIRKIIGSIEKSGIGFTDVLFLVDETRCEQVKGSKIQNLVYIYNTPADVNKQPQKRAEKTDKYAGFKIFYAGALLEDRGLKQFIKAIEEIPDVQLLLAGLGPVADDLEKIPEVLIRKIQYLRWLSYDEVIRYSLDADILFAFYNPAIPNNRFASPNKLFEAMMCGKPIIVSNCSRMADIVKEENCGLVVSYGDIQGLVESILKLKNSQELRKTFGENGRNAYVTKYSWEMMEKRLLTAYSRFN